MLAGCQVEQISHEAPQPQPGIHAYFSFDTSQSCRPQLGNFAQAAARIDARLDPDHDRLTLYRVDTQTLEFSDKAAPESAETLQELLTSQLKACPAENGTFPEKFWTEVARRAGEARQGVIIAYFSDGDNDNFSPASTDTLRTAARQLADNPHVLAVAIYGASPENWKYLRDCFGCLGDRFLIYSPQEIDIEPLMAIIEKGRHK